MRINRTWLGLGLSLLGLLTTTGCSTTATGIAEGYGVLDNPEIARIIESGKADDMIHRGQADVRHREVSSGGRDVLVTEYLLFEEVYRIEVREATNPLEGIPNAEVQLAEAQQGDWQETMRLFKLAGVLDCLRKDSYQARPRVAYRAWKGSDGKVHGIRVMEGNLPKWPLSEDDLNLYIRTHLKPITTMWFRQVVQADDDEPMPRNSRWIMESPGPRDPNDPLNQGQQKFINRELDGLIR